MEKWVNELLNEGTEKKLNSISIRDRSGIKDKWVRKPAYYSYVNSPDHTIHMDKLAKSDPEAYSVISKLKVYDADDIWAMTDPSDIKSIKFMTQFENIPKEQIFIISFGNEDNYRLLANTEGYNYPRYIIKLVSDDWQ